MVEQEPPIKRYKTVGSSFVVRLDTKSPLNEEDGFNFAISDDTEVVVVSQTVRRFGDVNNDKRYIILPVACDLGHGMVISESRGEQTDLGDQLLWTFVKDLKEEMKDLKKVMEEMKEEMKDPSLEYTFLGMKTTVCDESLKLLEAKFQPQLESNGGLRSNADFVQKMGPIMKVASRQGASVGWFLDSPIGVLAEGICLLKRAQEDAEQYSNMFGVLIQEAEDFFWSILEDGLDDIFEGMDQMESDFHLVEFFTNKAYVSHIISEFAICQGDGSRGMK